MHGKSAVCLLRHCVVPLMQRLANSYTTLRRPFLSWGPPNNLVHAGKGQLNVRRYYFGHFDSKHVCTHVFIIIAVSLDSPQSWFFSELMLMIYREYSIWPTLPRVTSLECKILTFFLLVTDTHTPGCPLILCKKNVPFLCNKSTRRLIWLLNRPRSTSWLWVVKWVT